MIVLKFIKVEITMWPGGSEKKEYPLGRMFIWNEGTSKNQLRADYGYCVMRRGEQKMPYEGGKTVRKGRILHYPRAAYNVWELVRRALQQAFG